MKEEHNKLLKELVDDTKHDVKDLCEKAINKPTTNNNVINLGMNLLTNSKSTSNWKSRNIYRWYANSFWSQKKDVLSIVAVASNVPFVVSTKNMI